MIIGGIALYVHVPFCRQRCRYCSFVSFAGREADIPAYLLALDQEIAGRAAGQRVSTVFIGGGTPSLLTPDQLGRILNTIRAVCRVEDRAEISLEANPGTVDDGYLAAVRKLGINRLSLGAQSFDPQSLAILGRIHSADQTRGAVSSARKAGFVNLNLDLIYGVPGQTTGGWMSTLAEAVSFAPEHLSLYPLTLEEEAPLYSAILAGEVAPLDPDLTAEQYEAAEDYLEREGYQHYEISNWARKGTECRHNMAYWQGTPYLGIGVAAHSFFDGRRRANTVDLGHYIREMGCEEQCDSEHDEEVSPEIALWESIVMPLRLSDGIDLTEVVKRFGTDSIGRHQDQINELVLLGLLEQDGPRIRLTRRGRLLGNEVFRRFLPAEPSGRAP